MNNTIKALIGGLIVAGTAELFYQYGKGIGIGALKKGNFNYEQVIELLKRGEETSKGIRKYRFMFIRKVAEDL